MALVPAAGAPAAGRRGRVRRDIRALIHDMREAIRGAPAEEEALAIADEEPAGPVLDPALELFFSEDEHEAIGPEEPGGGAPALASEAEAVVAVAAAPMDAEAGERAPDTDVEFRHARSMEGVQNAVSEMVRIAVESGDILGQDPAIEPIVSLFIDDGQSLLRGSAKSIANRIGVEPRALVRNASNIAAISFTAWAAKMRHSIRGISNAYRGRGGRVVSLSSSLRLDETPLRMAIVSNENDVFHLLDTGDGDAVGFLEDKAALQIRTQSTCKLLAIENFVSLLVECNGEYEVFRWKPPSPYMALGRTTGDAYFRALQRNEAWLGFQDAGCTPIVTQRHVCSDADDAITLAERGRADMDRNEDEVQLKVLCSSHIASNIRDGVGKLRPEAQQGLKHAVLSLRFGNYLKLFRTAVKVVAKTKMRVVRNRMPSAHARARNETWLDIVCEKDGTNKASY